MRSLRHAILIAGLVCPISMAKAAPELIEVTKASAAIDPRIGLSIINLTLSEKSGRLLAKITQENLGRTMHLRVDGNIIMSPVIREPILGGSLQISGDFSLKEAESTANRILSGAKVEVEVVP